MTFASVLPRRLALARLVGLCKPFTRRPFASSAVGVMLLASLVVAVFGIPQSDVTLVVSTSFDSVITHRRWWTLITSLFIQPHPVTLLLAVPVTFLAVGIAERTMGTRRTIIAYLVTGVVGALVTIGIEGIAIQSGDAWSANVAHTLNSNTYGPATGALLMSSAWMGPMWRRRVRLGLSLIAIVAVAYSGSTTDFLQFFASATGLIMGLIWGPAPTRLRWIRSSHYETRTLVASCLLVMGLGPVITVLSSKRLGALSPLGLLLSGQLPDTSSSSDCTYSALSTSCVSSLLSDPLASPAPLVATLLPLATFVVLAWGLYRGRRFAAWASIVVCLGTALLAAYSFGFLSTETSHHATTSLSFTTSTSVSFSLIVSMLLPTTIAALIAFNLRHFRIPTPKSQLIHFGITVGVALILAFGAAVAVAEMTRPEVSLWTQFTTVLGQLPERLIRLGSLSTQVSHTVNHSIMSSFVAYWAVPLLWLATIYAAWRCVTATGKNKASSSLGRARTLLLRGGGSLSHMATWSLNRLWFSKDGSGGVAYQVWNGVAITVAAPFGDTAHQIQAASEFATFCDDHGWVPTFYTVGEPLAGDLRDLGWSCLLVGEETIIDPHSWSPRGKRAQDVRTAMNKMARIGVSAVWTSFSALTPAMRERIVALSESWVAERGLPEMSFTLGGVEELRDDRVGLLLAMSASGELMGVTSWLPSYKDGVIRGWTLDFMRRIPDSVNGVMEFLIASMVERNRDEPDIDFVSLSVAPLAGVGNSPESGSMERILGLVGDSLEPAYGFASLHAFKQKFLPELKPVYAAYPDPTALPAIGMAIVSAYFPEQSLLSSARMLRQLGLTQTDQQAVRS